MKFFKNILLLASAAMFVGCSDLDKVTASSDPVPPVLQAHDPIVISAGNLAEQTTFKWSKADYGYSAATEYALYAQLDLNSPYLVTKAFGDSISIKLEDLNKGVVGAGAPLGVASNIHFFLSASISESFVKTNSASIVVSVTPFDPVSYIYLAGNALAQPWSPGDLRARLTAPLPTDGYEGMVDMNVGNPAPALNFKVCAQPNWDGPNYGGSVEALDPNGGDIADLPNGYYRIVVDKDITKIATKLKINTIGAIGNGVPGDWGSETKMTYDVATNTWSIPSIAMTNGNEFKLRINDDWGNAIGGTTAAAKFGGDNIKVEVPDGNYTMTLDAKKFPYVITLTPVN